MYWEDADTNERLGSYRITGNLYLHGSTGTGKTTKASRILKQTIIENTQLYGESQFVCLAKVGMVSIAQLLENLRKSYNNRGMTEGEMMAFYTTCDLLILDDLGADALTEWGVSKIFDIIDTRLSNLRLTVVTSNFSPRELYERFGSTVTAQAVVSRLSSYERREVDGKDRRL